MLCLSIVKVGCEERFALMQEGPLEVRLSLVLLTAISKLPLRNAFAKQKGAEVAWIRVCSPSATSEQVEVEI